jgi:hypothetical protein
LTVGLAKLLFPVEAKVAMDIAQVDGTAEFPLAIKAKNLGEARRTTVDLNEAPFRIQEEHLNRMRALSRTGNDASYLYLHLHDYIFCFLIIPKHLVIHTFQKLTWMDKFTRLMCPFIAIFLYFFHL